MFPRRMSLLEVRMNCRLSLQAFFKVALEDIAVLGECCPSGRDLSLNILVLVFVFGALYMSQADTFQRSRYHI